MNGEGRIRRVRMAWVLLVLASRYEVVMALGLQWRRGVTRLGGSLVAVAGSRRASVGYAFPYRPDPMYLPGALDLAPLGQDRGLLGLEFVEGEGLDAVPRRHREKLIAGTRRAIGAVLAGEADLPGRHIEFDEKDFIDLSLAG